MIGDYERIGVVSQTGTTTVWKAFDPGLKRTVALKHVTRVDAAAAARGESAVLARLRHPNIIAVHDVFDGGDDTVWLVEQWVNGAPLSVVLTRTGRLHAIDALALVHGALSGLAYAHDHDVVHGDVTPANILIEESGRPMLVDFGLAGAPGQAGTGGTPGYMAPEAAYGRVLDKRSDVYSSCVVLAELLQGAHLFPHSSILAITEQQTKGVPPLDGIEAPVAAVLHRGLDPDASARPVDAGALLTQLESAVEETHGRGWLATAGLAAIGSTAATIGAGVTLTGAAGPATETTAAAPVTPTPSGVLARRRLITAGTTALAIIAAVLAFFLLHANPPKHTARPQSSPSTSTSTSTSTPPPGATPPPTAAIPPPPEGPWLRGTYTMHDMAGPEAERDGNIMRFSSDCARCDATLLGAQREALPQWGFHWIGTGWQHAMVCSCDPPPMYTLTPTVVVDGIAQELSYRFSASGVKDTVGTLTRSGD